MLVDRSVLLLIRGNMSVDDPSVLHLRFMTCTKLRLSCRYQRRTYPLIVVNRLRGLRGVSTSTDAAWIALLLLLRHGRHNEREYGKDG